MDWDENAGTLGWVSQGIWEAIHADWPAYPGDRSWQIALLRFGDFPLGLQFTCLSVIDQCALFVAETANRKSDPFDERNIHIAVRLEELLELDDRDLVTGIELTTSMSPDQILMKRALGPDDWEKFYKGELVLGVEVDGGFRRLAPPEDEEPWEDCEADEIYPSLRSPERMAIYPGTVITLKSAAASEVQRIGRLTLEIPLSVQPRIAMLLAAGLFDSAVRDLGAVLEMRMRALAKTDKFGWKLIEAYTQALIDTKACLPARIKSLRQELRCVFQFIRNEFAHQIVELDPARGYALVARLCWHIRDVELLIDEIGRE